MPLIELATVRLKATDPIPPPSFKETWMEALQGASSAAGIPFHLYRSTTDQSVYYLLGGWLTGADHIAFLNTPAALDLAKAIGVFMTVDLVRHISGDIAPLGPRPQRERLTVSVRKVPVAHAGKWEGEWMEKGVGGWDESAVVQKQHAAFRKMGELTSSVDAFGGTDVETFKEWIWVESATDAFNNEAAGQSIESEIETFEMEYVIG
ncbi:hypothetical protein LTR10_020083 [Elasticomyces elasticus]|uniref:ABM domain-containing protein n=1 Tax=Exophiala sideris TaxID=1016849 RepID=A0ABR0IX25_9EURO|nr:hypothetical protein LTR10_020083 [Elasticomyces elasticus]KAK5021335.1 hypothetical protein LTS07_011078 [Exophiala sideris]KAK5024283.1 hypothetical protein LTR13_010904 [Exophiala sideris]KAK5049226.1 hypothetical protein LTR69_011101 [Exophiala sideris]KAK5176538.1 hypothetical protein LTR44_010926 [Eurotiomycetes sp. CCFEE 6388]